jgi:hypothetical protein
MSIDPKLQAVLKEVSSTLEQSWKGEMGEDLRPWLNFSGITESGKFDFDALLDIFDRKKLSDDYAKARSNPESLSRDVWIPKASSDWLAGFQRDHMMRTRSRIRFVAHAAVRYKANSTAEGPLTVNLLSWLTRLETVKTEES